MKKKITLPRLTLLPLVLVLVSSGCGVRAASLAPDMGFHPPSFTQLVPPQRSLLRSDGKYFLFSGMDTLADQRTGPITRFLADGTLDTSFNFDRTYNRVTAAAATLDGKLYVAARKARYRDQETTEILRLNDDGTIDAGFPAVIVGTGSGVIVLHLRLQPDGKILVAGGFSSVAGETRSGIVRLLPNGGLDSSFAPVETYGTSVWATALQADGKIIITGDFLYVNSATSRGVARLNADGTVDSSFAASGYTQSVSAVRGVIVQPDGKIVVGGRFRVTSSSYAPVLRFNADGSQDSSFTLLTSLPYSFVRDLKQQGDDKLICALGDTVYRLNTDGTIDADFTRPTLSRFGQSYFGAAYPVTVDLSADGKIVAGGLFTDVSGSGQPPYSNFGVLRLQTDGTLDTTLSTSHQTGYASSPSSFARRADGSTFVTFGGDRLNITPTAANNFGRLLPNGALDPSFSLSPTQPSGFLANNFLASDFVPLTNGDHFVFGLDDNFAFKAGRISGEGVEDAAFSFNAPSLFFHRAHPLPGGKIMLSAGTDNSATAAATLTRLLPDGTVDGMFQFPDSIRQQQIQRDVGTSVILSLAVGSRVLAVQPDGKLIFEYFTPGGFHVARLNEDGSLDNSFSEIYFPRPDYAISYPQVYDPITGQVYQVPTSTASLSVLDAVVQPDGRIVLATRAVGTQSRGLMRLEADGTFDPTFNTGGGAQWTETTETETFVPKVEDVALLPNGKFLIIGTFEAFSGVAAPGIALLNSDGSVDTSFVAPAVRDKSVLAEASLAVQPDGSFLLGGPYYLPGEPTAAPSLIHILSAPFISSALNAAGVQNQSFNYQIATSGAATSFGATGLPPGLNFNASTGLISGTPTVNGTFLVSLSATNAVGTETATLTLTIAPGGTVNIATRLAVGTGDDVLIGGFIITGDAPKKVLLRAIGSSLNVNGMPVPGRLIDPVLELRGNNLLMINDDWRSNQEAEIAAVLPPPDDRESAIIAVVEPGAYTAVVRGKNGATGVGLVEVYDLGNPNTPSTGSASLVNISTRGFVQSGDNVMIGGFIITGGTTNVIVRAIGPDLTNRGVPGALQDTTIELFDANGLVASNDDWRSTQEQQIIATTVPPADDRESAIVAALGPGGYTAVVRGKNGMTGVALVEAYALP